MFWRKEIKKEINTLNFLIGDIQRKSEIDNLNKKAERIKNENEIKALKLQIKKLEIEVWAVKNPPKYKDGTYEIEKGLFVEVNSVIKKVSVGFESFPLKIEDVWQINRFYSGFILNKKTNKIEKFNSITEFQLGEKIKHHNKKTK